MLNEIEYYSQKHYSIEWSLQAIVWVNSYFFRDFCGPSKEEKFSKDVEIAC